MKPRLVTLALIQFAATHSFANTPNDVPTSSADEALPSPSPRQKVKLPPKEEDIETFVLKPVKAKAETEHFVFEHERYESLHDQPFTWKDGGLLYEHVGKRVTTKLGWQYDARNRAISLLNVSF